VLRWELGAAQRYTIHSVFSDMGSWRDFPAVLSASLDSIEILYKEMQFLFAVA
jgi:hypothetical protein